MKTFRYILLFCLLLLVPGLIAGTPMESKNPNWLGGTEAFNTTEGNDFWLTFINNNNFDPGKPENQMVKFEMKVAIAAREEVDVTVAYGTTVLTTLHVAAGTTQVYEIPRANAAQIYLFESEQNGKNGVHVYASPTSPENKKKVFSCFLYSRTNDSPITSRDASLVLPTRFLGKEYIIQTYPEDVYSSEFGIVATKDRTTVTINPAYETEGGHAIGTPFEVTLNKGQAYLIATKRREEGAKNFNADFSGTTICADQPIAVFAGNQQTGIPNKEGYSQDFMVEQTLPVSQFGTKFYLTGLTNTKSNYADIVALYDGTEVTITTYDKSTGQVVTYPPVTLNRGGTLQKIPPDSAMLNLQDEMNNEVIISTSAPVSCFSYTSTAAENKVCTTIGWSQKCYIYGDPSSAIMPHWGLRTDSMTFFTEKLDPFGSTTIPQHFYAYVVTDASDVNTFTLNGTAVPASEFQTFHADNTKAYAHLELPDAATSPYNFLKTTGGGFVGMVYGLTEAQGYYYTLGFKPEAHPDSLYVTNTAEVVMSHASYDLDSIAGHGWYQRQWSEWMEGHEQLDTAIICDSSSVYWAIETSLERPATQIEWMLFDVTDHKKPGGTPEASLVINPASTDTKHTWSHEFILPEEEMDNRHQYFEYELQAVLHRERLMCEGEDIDTLKTTVRVTRIFNDTLYRVVCVGDTLRFFYDSLYNQSDLSLHRSDSAATKFVGVKKGQGDKYLQPWVYQVEVGKYDTLSRHYISQAGCDSMMTLVLFVCDTFQYFDTIHLCSNQDTLYHGKRYRASDYWKPRSNPSIPIKEDTIDLKLSFTTKACECQLDPSISKFRDKRGRPFNGCDSTYFLHLILHPAYLIQMYDTVCLDKDGKGSCTWPVHYDTETRVVTQDEAVYNPAFGAKAHAFVDSMYTHSCPECNHGVLGCDSFIVKTTLFPASYHFEEDTVKWCKLKYDPVKQDTVHRYFEWTGHLDEHGKVRVLRETGDYYDSCSTKRYGCDSIYHIRVEYQTTTELYLFTDTTVCQNPKDTVYWIGLQNDTLGIFPADAPGTIRRYDDSRCDTVYALRVRVLPSYSFTDQAKMSEEMSYLWTAGDTVFFYGTKYTGPMTQYENRLVECGIIKDTAYMKTKAVDGYECDSIRDLVLEVGSVYRYVTNDFLCATQYSYRWKGYDKDGNEFTRKVITESELPAPNYHLTYEQAYKTTLGYDSVYVLDLFRAPSYMIDTLINVCQVDGGTFEWDDREGRTIYNEQTGEGVSSLAIPIETARDFYYLDYLHTDSFGCDSTWRLHLHIYPYYHKDTTMTICQFEDFVWPNNNQDSIHDDQDRRIATVPTDHTGDYTYTVYLHSIYGCDSIYRLSLHIDTVYLTPVDTTQRTMCDNDTIHFYEHIIYGAKYKDKPAGVPGISIPGDAPYFSFDTTYIDKTIDGCDSTVVHRITMYRTYEFTEDSATCQTAGDRPEPYYTWKGHLRVWDVQRQRYIMGNEIPTKGVGNKTYIYIDSLKTQQCAVQDRYGECGCDSVHILRLRVDSSYYFYNPIKICDYDSITWQGKHYAGPKVKNPLPGYQVLKADTTYRDTLIHNTIHDCDSIYYLTLRVAPSYNDTITFNVCDNDSSEQAHVYIFRDAHGNYFRDSIEFNPTPTYWGIEKHDIIVDTTHLLLTAEGCDSLVTYHILIHPTYHFIEADKGCSGYAIEWRGQIIDGTGTYFDYQHTAAGCDSVFELDFYVKPFKVVPVYDYVCDNHSYYHRDTIGSTIFEEEVWHPGAPMPDPDKRPFISVNFKGADGCDSIVYQYHLTVCKTYEFETDTNGLCLGKPFEYTFDPEGRAVTHTWLTTAIEYDVNTFVQPFDTTFIDSLFTTMGCDSVFILNAHVFPSYRHIKYDTICANETYTWASRDQRPDSLVSGLTPGLYFLRDSFLTVDGCDSIYETQLRVHPNYTSTEHLTLCADETLQWRGHFYEHIAPGEYYEADQLASMYGCDSIFELYLTVLDTTYEINYDSICIGDTLFVGEHMYTQAGNYKDTTTNADGCHHFIYTRLTVIPPTVPTVWAEDAMCRSEHAFDLYYTYTSHKPVSYSLYFDSVGLEMGFEDHIDVPITAYTDPMVITVPIPYRGDDPTQYPKPDNYSVRLVLDNGICRHKETDCFKDSTFVMSYPKWLTEQRFGDVIALLNESLNGGYTWMQYQWYEGDTKLVGQTQPYLYIPTGLTAGAEYHVELTRDGEKEAFPTCPIVAVPNPVVNDKAPTMGYLSVVPTCIVVGHPHFNILSRKDGTYRVTTSDGVMVQEGTFRADVTEVQIPPTAGMYVVQLWSYDTEEEPYRAIKIIVREQCPNCATSF